MKLSDYATLTLQYHDLAVPNYRYLFVGSRLKLLRAMQTIDEVGVDRVLDDLLVDIEQLTRQVETSDDYIHQMVMCRLVAVNLDLIATLINKYSVVSNARLTQLDFGEMGMSRPLISKLPMIHEATKLLDGNPELFDYDGYIPGWMIRLIYKPNMTTNMVTEQYWPKYIQLSKLSASEFASKHAAYTTFHMNGSIRNVFGTMFLLMVGTDEYQKIMGRVHDLNSKLLLINYLLSGKSLPLNNPYGAGYSVIQNDKKVCFEGPLTDEHGIRCIDVM
ncbi:hypothetical protein BOW53_13340 [Solemya pervernicosa gill symbiont]|uniref:Uncharacterized protein n=1 Tax=Solemya pervernicosa gill symbiont TaxID=642797 RepID=A0A1T2L1T4_9GAMM|nr:hypothetical protein [Solemya pervernicosa gill symbiont]OOZ39024.1 hypothetical protein BOW53_13340 [Solemya pervernicosa gill symbiont]